VAAIVAIGKTNDNSSQESSSMGSGHSMAGMNGEGMNHMAPLPTGRVTEAPSDQGGAPLKGTLKNGVLEFTLGRGTAQPPRQRPLSRGGGGRATGHEISADEVLAEHHARAGSTARPAARFAAAA
jgi:hypothetical protein